MNAAPHPKRPAPGKWSSIALAVLVHAVLIAILVYGVTWQSRDSGEAIEVEVVRNIPQPPPPPPPPEPEVKPEPKPEPPPPPKPEPPKPDIALKEPLKPKKKEPPPPPRPEPKKPEPKKPEKPREAPRPALDDALRREEALLAQQKQAQASLARAAQEAAQLRQATADATTAARDRGMADYIGKIRGKIRGNLVLPPDIRGNPEAQFEVVQLPSGEILGIKLRKSSGHAAYDAAVERAIMKSSPLPRPAQGELFSRVLDLRFRPQDTE